MKDPRPALVRDPRFGEHIAPQGHPERGERLLAVDRGVAPLADQFASVEPRFASDEEILRVHHPDHLAALRAVAGRRAQLDPDTYASERSYDVARLAAGSAVDLALRIARGDSPRGFALVRPPGHHAEANGPKGFCLLNQIAIAARALRADAGIERVAVVDIDVHHGNGTQHSFESERDVLFLSSHQFPFYPGTGALAERGHGAGHGSTVNLPLPAGCGDAEYLRVYHEIALPLLRDFRPEIVLVSAGFDAHMLDPLASMQVTTEGFGALVGMLRGLADEVCGGRLLLTLEGGYDLSALEDTVRRVAEVLLEPKLEPVSPPDPTPAARDLLALSREAHVASA
jgi:acetoin utilization deacetylase AcuC-like enzyme